ncbi:MAG: high-potential iron-sulfur protein [Steroidobacteraceae bacterium]|jgi:hypothetical protein|nr:high-potential iron-sulfur protein [Steroidobacteraceae bacterium]
MNEPRLQAPTRRAFLRLVGGGVALLPVAGLVACSGDKPAPAPAAPAPEPAPAPAEPAAAVPEAPAATANIQLVPLEESDPAAVALGYRHDAAQVDTAKHPRFSAGQNCANCVQFRGQPGEAWAGCNLFPGRAVNAAGWCNGYAPKA